MTTQTLSSTRPTADEDAAIRAAALDSVRTVASALREVIGGDEHQARSDLSGLSDVEIAAVLPALMRTVGLLAGVESTRKAATR